MGPTTPPALVFSSSCSSTQPILLPPDKDLLLHVVAEGFRSGMRVSGAVRRFGSRQEKNLRSMSNWNRQTSTSNRTNMRPDR
jgi:hypothetical protein